MRLFLKLRVFFEPVYLLWVLSHRMQSFVRELSWSIFARRIRHIITNNSVSFVEAVWMICFSCRVWCVMAFRLEWLECIRGDHWSSYDAILPTNPCQCYLYEKYLFTFPRFGHVLYLGKQPKDSADYCGLLTRVSLNVLDSEGIQSRFLALLSDFSCKCNKTLSTCPSYSVIV